MVKVLVCAAGGEVTEPSADTVPGPVAPVALGVGEPLAVPVVEGVPEAGPVAPGLEPAAGAEPDPPAICAVTTNATAAAVATAIEIVARRRTTRELFGIP
jgi:hypothetical protein